MYSIAFGILRNRQDAQDVVQNAFIKLMKYLICIDDANCNKTKYNGPMGQDTRWRKIR